jgi:hypothetical protein
MTGAKAGRTDDPGNFGSDCNKSSADTCMTTPGGDRFGYRKLLDAIGALPYGQNR